MTYVVLARKTLLGMDEVVAYICDGGYAAVAGRGRAKIYPDRIAAMTDLRKIAKISKKTWAKRLFVEWEIHEAADGDTAMTWRPNVEPRYTYIRAPRQAR